MNRYYKVHSKVIFDDVMNKYNTMRINNPNDTFVLNIDNTTLLDYETLLRFPSNDNHFMIRVAGGYTDYRINVYTAQNLIDMHVYDNIYSVYELRLIMNVIREIESGLYSTWSDEQKLLYFISVLREKIMYDPEYEFRPSKDIRSLRGLVSGKSVCAGFALMLKELCDRQNIDCQYVEGSTKKELYDKGQMDHAWNLVKLDGNYIPIDLTWNQNSYWRGSYDDIKDLFNVPEFVKKHFPGKYEQIREYDERLKSINPSFVRNILNSLSNNRDIGNFIFGGKRNDGTNYYLVQIDQVEVDGKKLYRYLYKDHDKNGRDVSPVILYSGSNLARYMFFKRFKEDSLIPKGYGRFVDRLMTRQNIINAIQRGDYYIGDIVSTNQQAKGLIFDTNILGNKKLLVRYRQYIRRDGSKFSLQSVLGYPKVIEGRLIYAYDMFEYRVTTKGKMLRKNRIYSDNEMTNDNRPELPNYFLTDSRIERKVRNNGGYLGHLEDNYRKVYTKELSNYFDKSVRQKLSSSDFISFYRELSFFKLKFFNDNYDVRVIQGHDIVISKNNGIKSENKIMLNYVVLSKWWIYALRNMGSREAEEAYNFINELFNKNVRKYGNINTEVVAYLIKNNSSNVDKYLEVLKTLFSNDLISNFINNYYRLLHPEIMDKKEKKQTISNLNTTINLGRYQIQLGKQESNRRVYELLSDGSYVETTYASVKNKLN